MLRLALFLCCFGCAATEESSVTLDSDPPTPGTRGITWETGAADFFDAYCDECHDGQVSAKDFAVYDDVVEWSREIRCGVAPSSSSPSGCGPAMPAAAQFPVGSGPEPPDEEREEIVGWIDAGAPL